MRTDQTKRNEAIGWFLLCLAVVALMATSGCAQFNTRQRAVDSVDDAGNPIRTVTTDATAVSLFAGKQALAGWKASQTTKSQGASLSAIDQTADIAPIVAMALEAYKAGQTGGVVRQAPRSMPDEADLLGPHLLTPIPKGYRIIPDPQPQPPNP